MARLGSRRSRACTTTNGTPFTAARWTEPKRVRCSRPWSGRGRLSRPCRRARTRHAEALLLASPSRRRRPYHVPRAGRAAGAVVSATCAVRDHARLGSCRARAARLRRGRAGPAARGRAGSRVLSLPPSVRLFVATQPIDGRKGADSLMALVREVFRHDPLVGPPLHLLLDAVRPRAHRILGPQRIRDVDQTPGAGSLSPDLPSDGRLGARDGGGGAGVDRRGDRPCGCSPSAAMATRMAKSLVTLNS